MSSLNCVFFHTSEEISTLTQGGDFEKVSKNSWYSSLQEMELNSLSQECGLDLVTHEWIEHGGSQRMSLLRLSYKRSCRLPLGVHAHSLSLSFSPVSLTLGEAVSAALRGEVHTAREGILLWQPHEWIWRWDLQSQSVFRDCSPCQQHYWNLVKEPEPEPPN